MQRATEGGVFTATVSRSYDGLIDVLAKKVNKKFVCCGES